LFKSGDKGVVSFGRCHGVNTCKNNAIDVRLASEPIVNVVIKYRPLGLTC